MPRVHINLHDLDEIEELEQQEDWEKQIGLNGIGQRRDVRDSAEARAGRGAEHRELRFGGAEARDRRRAERRKQIARSGRHFSPQHT